MAEVSMRCLLNMPYEIVFEIFRDLPKGKLSEISRLCPKFGEVAGDKRLWKDVYIKYEPRRDEPVTVTYAFEELYSGPSPVKVIDLSFIEIKPPVSFETDQIVKVEKLDLSGTVADKSTMEAILAKYQFTELHLNCASVDLNGHINGIAPETFSNRTDLEVLSLRGILGTCYDTMTQNRIHRDFLQWLALVLNKYCKNLKTLDFSYNCLLDRYMFAFVKNLPTSLEKLCLADGDPYQLGNSFLELLARSLPNLKELELCRERAKYPALLEFKCLEALHVIPHAYEDIRDLYMYLSKFPALKTVYIDNGCQLFPSKYGALETLRAKLKPHGITVKKTNYAIKYDNNFWQKTNTI